MANIIKETVRGFDRIAIEDELLKGREIFLVDEVNAATANELIKQLMYLEKQSNDEITLYINSPGGDVASGVAVYDYISVMRAPVRTVCIGTAASMGAILFLAGNKRLMLPRTRIMIHDPSFGRHDIGGRKSHQIQRELEDLNKVREMLAQIIADRTGKSIDEIYEVTAEDTFYNANEAIEFGLATGIFTSTDND